MVFIPAPVCRSASSTSSSSTPGIGGSGSCEHSARTKDPCGSMKVLKYVHTHEHIQAYVRTHHTLLRTCSSSGGKASLAPEIERTTGCTYVRTYVYKRTYVRRYVQELLMTSDAPHPPEGVAAICPARICRRDPCQLPVSCRFKAWLNIWPVPTKNVMPTYVRIGTQPTCAATLGGTCLYVRTRRQGCLVPAINARKDEPN